jgi:sugar O-acyltransferase (sialic acid O-acetyltransferase NeuD family)
MSALGIFGTSGHAREVGDVACDLGFRPVYIARSEDDLHAWPFPDEVVLEADLSVALPCVIGIGDNAVREAVARRHAARKFVTLIHPSATFGQRQRAVVDTACGVVICAGVRLTNNIAVGDFSVFNRNVNIGHDVTVGTFVHIAPTACVSGNVRLGPACWIGAGAVINQGKAGDPLEIGARTMIASGAVVTASCDADAVYAGVPARRIK